MTGVDTTMVCHRVCDYHHYHLEEEERLTTMVTSIGDMTLGEGRHYDTMTGSTTMLTTMQDRLQERSSVKRPTTSSDYIIRLTDRLLRCGTKIISCFSQFQEKRSRSEKAILGALGEFQGILGAAEFRKQFSECEITFSEWHLTTRAIRKPQFSEQLSEQFPEMVGTQLQDFHLPLHSRSFF